MRHSAILNALALVTTVVAVSPIFLKTSTNLDGRTLHEPGCANFYGDDQHIKLYSGGNVYELWVPTDDKTYNVGKPFARLNCNEVSSLSEVRNPICAECWDRMNYVEVLSPGTCSFALTNDNNKIVTMDSDQSKGKNPFPAAGYLALVTCRKPPRKRARGVADTQLICDQTNYPNITIWTGSSEYILSVPANETVFDVVGPDSRLGCVGPIGWKYDMCQACNFPVQRLILSTEAGTCAFNFTGYADLVYHNARWGSLSPPSSVQIWSVQCGLPDQAADTNEAPSQVQSGPGACPAWANSTTIQLVEGGTGMNVDLAIPPDGSLFNIGHPPYDVGCSRPGKLYSECFPCTMLFQEIQIGNVDCFLELLHEDGITTDFELLQGPVGYKFPVDQRLISVQCFKQLGNDKRSLRVLSADHGASLIDSTAYDSGRQDSNLRCTMGSGITLVDTQGNWSYLAVPTDARNYSLFGNDPDLGCYFYDESSSMPCHSCHDFGWVAMLPPDDLGECHFKVERWQELLIWPANDRKMKHFYSPIKVLQVACGFGLKNNPPASVEALGQWPQEIHSPTARPFHGEVEHGTDGSTKNTGAGVHHDQPGMNDDSHVNDLAVLTREVNASSAEKTCQGSSYKVTIQSGDGNTYFAPVPLDYKFHPTADMMCVRLKDAACVSCSQIGKAVSVSTAVRWGPCTFSTDNHRQFFTQYMDSQPDGSLTTTLVSIEPGADIVGIECGRGA